MANVYKNWTICPLWKFLKSLWIISYSMWSKNSEEPRPTLAKAKSIPFIWRASQIDILITSFKIDSWTRSNILESFIPRLAQPVKIWLISDVWNREKSCDKISSSQISTRGCVLSPVLPRAHIMFASPWALQDEMLSEIKSKISKYALSWPFLAFSLSLCRTSFSALYLWAIFAILWRTVILFTSDVWSLLSR